MNRPAASAAFALTAALACGFASAQEAWSYELIPFLWASGIDGRIGVGNAGTDVHASFSDLLDLVNVGGAMRIIARKDRVQWYGEGSYLDLGNATTTASGQVTVQTTQTLLEAGLSYDFTPQLAPYGGLRFQDVRARVNTVAGSNSNDRNWVDAFVGGRWTPLRTDQWTAWLRGDIGAGGSKFVWLAEAGVGFHFGSRWGLYLTYRLLDDNYDRDDFLYDVRQSGLLFGFGIRL
jgi:opacity protein-like surface antigen